MKGVTSSATAMGCTQYRGKDGTDEPGTWRTPTYREGILMLIFREQIEATSAETGFQPFTRLVFYWLGTESGPVYAWAMRISQPYELTFNYNSSKASKTSRLRCIRDVEWCSTKRIRELGSILTDRTYDKPSFFNRIDPCEGLMPDGFTYANIEWQSTCAS